MGGGDHVVPKRETFYARRNFIATTDPSVCVKGFYRDAFDSSAFICQYQSVAILTVEPKGPPVSQPPQDRRFHPVEFTTGGPPLVQRQILRHVVMRSVQPLVGDDGGGASTHRHSTKPPLATP